MEAQQHCPVVIIGAGQAGLCASYWLGQRNIPHAVFEKREAASAWKRERWDSFCLVTPNWQCQLSGFPYRGTEPKGFMSKQEIVEYLDAYRRWVNPPLHEGVEVKAVCRDFPNARFSVETTQGKVTADAVITCIGAYHSPILPGFSVNLPDHVVQLQSRDYRNPQQLPPGAVLVVGSGQSGCQIAEDLHLAGRRVHLCLGDAPRSPRVYRGKDVVEWLEQMGYYDLPVEAHPDVDATRDKTNHYLTGRDGGREIDLRRFALEGMRLYGYLKDIEGGRCVVDTDVGARLDAADAVYNGIRAMIDQYIQRSHLAVPEELPYRPVWSPREVTPHIDLDKEGITSVVWSIGFRTDFGMLDVPVFDERGIPRHVRGVSSEPGLYFLGLPWLHTWGSARMSAVGRDAEYVVNHLSDYLLAVESRGVPRQSGPSMAEHRAPR